MQGFDLPVDHERTLPLALTSKIPIPPAGVHTVKAIPSILYSLTNQRTPSLRNLCQWTNQFYNQKDFDIRQCIDGDILQVLNGLHLSGLLQHKKMCKKNEILTDTDDEEEAEKENNDGGAPSSESSSSENESEEEESSSSVSSSSTQ